MREVHRVENSNGLATGSGFSNRIRQISLRFELCLEFSSDVHGFFLSRLVPVLLNLPLISSFILVSDSNKPQRVLAGAIPARQLPVAVKSHILLYKTRKFQPALRRLGKHGVVFEETLGSSFDPVVDRC